MAELPKDPRQLARDILSGKISIEDLAREQARRKAGLAQGSRPTPPPVPPSQLNQRPGPIAPEEGTVPAAQRMPTQASRNVPANAPQRRPVPVQNRPVRPTPPRPVAARPGQLPQTPIPVRPGTQRQVQGAGQMPRPAQQAMPPVKKVPQTLAAKLEAPPVVPPAARPVPAPLRLVFNDRANLRRAIILAEIVNKPVALRDEHFF